MKIRMLKIIGIIALSVLVIYCTWYVTYSTFSEHLTISKTEFCGTYHIENSSKTLDDEYLSIYNKSGKDTPNVYRRFDTENVISQNGSCKVTDENILTFYINNKIKGTLLYSYKKYYYVPNGGKAIVVKKISDAATLSSGKYE